MFAFLKSAQWSFAFAGGAGKAPAPWSLDRNWHRSEAERHLKARNYGQALRHLEKVVEEADQRRSPPKQRIRFRLELADTQRRVAGQHEEMLAAAETTVRDAIAIAAEVSDREEYVNGLDALADVFADQKNYKALEKVEQEALRLGAALAHPDPLRMAKRVHRLAVARHKNGLTEASATALEKSISLHENTVGEDSREMAELLYEIGAIFRAQGNLARAKECLQRSVDIYTRELGGSADETIGSLQQLAGCHEDAGDPDGAAAHYERCLLLKLRKVGVQYIEETAVLQYSLANLHTNWGNLARARELLTECIGVFRHQGGPRLAVAHELLAQVEERSGRFHGAVREMESAGKAWEKAGRTIELARNMQYRADLLDQLRKAKDAAILRETAAKLEQEAGAQAHTA